jgi:hypothetical protein
MLKMGLRGRCFATVEDIKEDADARLRAIKNRRFSSMLQLDRQMEHVCVCADGKYFEGD